MQVLLAMGEVKLALPKVTQLLSLYIITVPWPVMSSQNKT